MKKKLLFGICAALAVLAAVTAAISFFRPQKGHSEKNDWIYVDNRGYFSTEDGLYYVDGENFLWFYDYASGQNAIVCNKPNCEHARFEEGTPEEQRCHAYVGIGRCDSVFAYDEKLYTVESDPKTNRIRIVKSGPDRNAQTLLASLDCEYIGSFVVKDGTLYFSSLKNEMEKDESGMPVQTGISCVALCSLNLASGKVTELYVMNRHYNAELCILGIYEGSIYSFYGYFEHKFTGLNFEEAKRKLTWHAYQIETQEMSETAAELTDIDLGQCQMQDNLLFYGKWRDRDNNASDIFRYDLATGENKKAISDSFQFRVFDGKVAAKAFNGETIVLYDVATEKTSPLAQHKAELSVLAEHQDDFIVAAYKDGKASYGRMKKDDFYNGKEEFEAFMEE